MPNKTRSKSYPSFVFGKSKERALSRNSGRFAKQWRCYNAILPFTALSAFAMAVPGTAWACVNTCSPGGVPVQFNNGTFCSGGVNDGQQFCTGPSTPSTPATMLTPAQKAQMERAMQNETNEQQRRQALAQELLNALSGLPYNGGFPYGGGQLGNGSNYPDTPYFGLPPYSGLSGHLGMYVSNGGGADVNLSGGGYSLRNSGTTLSDTAGLIAPGTQSSSYRENGGGGGISGVYDASRLVGANQGLAFIGKFDYTSAQTSFGGTSAGSSINSDSYNFSAAAMYRNYNTYVMLMSSYQFGNNSEFNSLDGSSGNYRSNGYDVDATVGHIFWLMNTIAPPGTSRMAVKAPPKPSDGYALGLDLSGHLGYESSVAQGFTDSTGFVFGDERAQGGVTGLNAKLFAVVQQYGVTWQPFISGSVDWRYDYSHIASYPGQLALLTGDTVAYSDATTFVGGSMGLDATMGNGWTVGAKGFYEHSSDTEIVGGKAYVKIPFGPTVVTARY